MTIDGEELYRRMAFGGAGPVVDVRTTDEYARRHIPGSLSIPLQELEERLDELPERDRPITVVCEHGLRSAAACRLLSEHGYAKAVNVDGGLAAWPGPVGSGCDERAYRHGIAPSSWLVAHFDRLPRGLALDIAMGTGRNAIYLATRGYDVDGVDAEVRCVTEARVAARRLGAPIRAVVGNFEDGTYIIPIHGYDLIVCFNYLHRPLFRDIRDGVRPGGVVVYQTYTTEQAQYGRPTNPDYLLRPGELRASFDGWEILGERELVGPARAGGKRRAIAGIVARKPD